MRMIALFFLIIAPQFAVAQKAVPFKSVVQRLEYDNKIKKKEDDFKAIFYLAQDYRFERNESQGYTARRLMSLGFGLRYRERYVGFLEGGSYNDTTGVGNVRVDRSFETLNLSGALMKDFQAFAPYVGLGFGMARDTSNITIEGVASDNRSNWEPISHFMGGVRLFPKSNFWASLEAKFVVGPRVDPNPTAGFLLRVGAEL